MDKNRSRLAQEAREAERKAAEVKRQIYNLSRQIANPEKHLVSKDEKSESGVQRFRRYFSLDQTSVERRKPTRAEMRIQKNRTIALVTVAMILLFLVCNMIYKLFFH